MSSNVDTRRVQLDLHNARLPLRGLKSDLVIAEIEHRILTGEWEPGTMLPTEAELAEALGVSRSVIRDSVRALIARGLLTARAGRGTSVAEPDNSAFSEALLVLLTRSGLTVGQVNDARIELEASIAAAAARAATETDLALLEDAYAAFAATAERNDRNAAALLHTRLHTTIIEAVHLPALTLILRPLTEVVTLTGAASVRHDGPADWDVAAHRPIIDAIRAGDEQGAASAMRAHFASPSRPPAYTRLNGQKFSELYVHRSALTKP